MVRKPVSQTLHQQEIGREVWVRGLVTGAEARIVGGVQKYEVFFPEASRSWEKANGTELLVRAEDVQFDAR